MLRKCICLGLLFFSLMGKSLALPGQAIPAKATSYNLILADATMLESLGIAPVKTDHNLNLAVANVDELQLKNLPFVAHEFNKCGGFEILAAKSNINSLFSSISATNQLNFNYEKLSVRMLQVPFREEIKTAVEQVNIDNITRSIEWISAFQSRYHKLESGQQAVEEFAQKIKSLIELNPKIYLKLDLISHQKTQQKSIRVHIEGRTRPQELVIIGAHIDSISRWGVANAPGADDNASGAANVLEALRILSQKQPERSVEFFWYAGEEGGLLGSAEIATQYKLENKQVIGVLQLDMTAFAGEGETVLGSITDYTSTWLRDYLSEINKNYVGASFVEDKCGYGCSDHASWYRQGYPTVMPFEARMNTMNTNIHTPYDVIAPSFNFKHSLLFAKLAVAYLADLSNSDLKQPY